RADLDRGGLVVAAGQREAELVEGVVDQRLAGHQQHARLGQVADVAHRLAGHRIGDRNLPVGLAPPCAPEFLHHAGALAVVASSPRPAKLRSALTAACHARSTRRPRSAVTRRAWPLAIIRARLSRVCSATRWPRWLTNRALSVIRLYQDRRRRTTSPCWLTTNSSQQPNGSTLSWSYCACSSAVRCGSFGFSARTLSSPRRTRALSFIASSVREAGSSASSSALAV